MRFLISTRAWRSTTPGPTGSCTRRSTTKRCAGRWRPCWPSSATSSVTRRCSGPIVTSGSAQTRPRTRPMSGPRWPTISMVGQRGPDMGLVRGLVGAEPDVTVGPEHLRVTELVAELGQQGLHRPAHLFVVDLLVQLPVGPGVVHLQAFVEVKRRIGPAVEGHCWSFHLTGASDNRLRKSRVWHQQRACGRIRPADLSLSYRLGRALAVVRSGS